MVIKVNLMILESSISRITNLRSGSIIKLWISDSKSVSTWVKTPSKLVYYTDKNVIIPLILHSGVAFN